MSASMRLWRCVHCECVTFLSGDNDTHQGECACGAEWYPVSRAIVEGDPLSLPEVAGEALDGIWPTGASHEHKLGQQENEIAYLKKELQRYKDIVTTVNLGSEQTIARRRRVDSKSRVLKRGIRDARAAVERFLVTLDRMENP
jgi:hypothetical protein